MSVFVQTQHPQVDLDDAVEVGGRESLGLVATGGIDGIAASAGLDTGRPGYTLGFTPQPHNEGDFTTLGHVVRGLDAMVRLEFGDKITGARIITR